MNLINRSSASDLYNLCDALGVKNIVVCSKDELRKYLKNKKVNNIIFNMANDQVGSHWVAICKNHKIYFDSYMQKPPSVVPKDYRLSGSKKELQSMSAQDCGQLCSLWLYYINFKSNKDYLDLFEDVYK